MKEDLVDYDGKTRLFKGRTATQPQRRRCRQLEYGYYKAALDMVDQFFPPAAQPLGAHGLRQAGRIQASYALAEDAPAPPDHMGEKSEAEAALDAGPRFDGDEAEATKLGSSTRPRRATRAERTAIKTSIGQHRRDARQHRLAALEVAAPHRRLLGRQRDPARQRRAGRGVHRVRRLSRMDRRATQRRGLHGTHVLGPTEPTASGTRSGSRSCAANSRSSSRPTPATRASTSRPRTCSSTTTSRGLWCALSSAWAASTASARRATSISTTSSRRTPARAKHC